MDIHLAKSKTYDAIFKCDYLIESILEVIENWNLGRKMTGITHDNAYNITKAIKIKK